MTESTREKIAGRFRWAMDAADVNDPDEHRERVADLAAGYVLSLLSESREDQGVSDTGRVAELEKIAALARELVSPAGMVNRGVDRGLVVVEKADKSDPHYRLCTALDALAAAPTPPAATEGVDTEKLIEALEPFAKAWEKLQDPLPQGPFTVSVDANACAIASVTLHLAKGSRVTGDGR